MPGSLLQRARFMVRLALTLAKRALPSAAGVPVATIAPDETLIEALQTGDLAALVCYGPRLALGKDRFGSPLFFVALETGSLTAVTWFLDQGASATRPDRSGRLPLEAVIQRAALADDLDDHTADCTAMAQALIARGASLVARGVTGATLADLAAAAGLDLT
jgi:hypothetical protein